MATPIHIQKLIKIAPIMRRHQTRLYAVTELKDQDVDMQWETILRMSELEEPDLSEEEIYLIAANKLIQQLMDGDRVDQLRAKTLLLGAPPEIQVFADQVAAEENYEVFYGAWLQVMEGGWKFAASYNALDIVTQEMVRGAFRVTPELRGPHYTFDADVGFMNNAGDYIMEDSGVIDVGDLDLAGWNFYLASDYRGIVRAYGSPIYAADEIAQREGNYRLVNELDEIR